jgi:exonuclease SbcD
VKVLHTSDWHLGRTLQRRSRDVEFDAVLAEIAGIAAEVQPDLVVHSGDLFDVGRPAPKDVLRAMRCLTDLAEIAPTVVLGGNHDSPEVFDLLGYWSSAGRADTEGRLRFVHSRGDSEPGYVLDFDSRDGSERIRLAALPYVHPNRYMRLFPGFGTTEGIYAAGLRELQEGLMGQLQDGYDPDRDVLLFAAHQYVASALPSRSERQTDTRDAYATDADALPKVAYCALGHIHKPQAVGNGRPPARYAGSPLQLDFGESKEVKSVVVVEASPGRRALATLRTLTSGRRLAHFEGTLEQLAMNASEYDGVYLKVLVRSEEPVARLGETVADLVPGAVLVDVQEDCAATRVTALTHADAVEETDRDVADVFAAYLADKGTPGQNADEVVAAFAELLAAPDGEVPLSPAETLLQDTLATPWTRPGGRTETA